MLVCENAAITLWYYPKPKFIELASLAFYIKPIKLLTNVSSIKFIKNPPLNIVEGVKFGSNSTPILQVLDTTGIPLSGKLVIALICNYEGKDYPKRYTNIRKGFKSKKFLNPFPGEYNSESNNPLSSVDPVIPLTTDSKGYVFFNESYFSKYGPSGKYKLEFICDGINVISPFINVLLIFFYFLKN